MTKSNLPVFYTGNRYLVNRAYGEFVSQECCGAREFYGMNESNFDPAAIVMQAALVMAFDQPPMYRYRDKMRFVYFTTADYDRGDGADDGELAEETYDFQSELGSGYNWVDWRDRPDYLKRYIEDNGLGTCHVVSDFEDINPNSGNPLHMMVWVTNLSAIETWTKEQLAQKDKTEQDWDEEPYAEAV